MSTITIQLSEAQADRLAKAALRRNVSVEELAKAILLDLTAQPDDDFNLAAKYVFDKNAELYRRLA
jgi:hypothetical protein